jgi:hypothetical protein
MKTKHILTIFGLILTSILNINAQDFKFGLVTGFDITDARLSEKLDINGDYNGYDPMISFNVNGYIGYKSAGFWGLSVEPGFIQKGGIQTYSDVKVRFQLNYIQMPILADIYISDKLFVSVGPELGYMINAKAKSKDYSNDITDIYDKRFELSGLIGVNYSIIKNVDIGIRYSYGLTYTSKMTLTDEQGNDKGEIKEFNQYLQLILRFKI